MQELMKEFNRKIESIKFSLDKNDGVIASQNTEAISSDIKTQSAIDVKIAGRSYSERIRYGAEICKWRIT